MCIRDRDKAERCVKLATGETLPYDRLILATGSRSFVPPMTGFGMAGPFVLRGAEDGLSIRALVRKEQGPPATAARGGVFGLCTIYNRLPTPGST